MARIINQVRQEFGGFRVGDAVQLNIPAGPPKPYRGKISSFNRAGEFKVMVRCLNRSDREANGIWGGLFLDELVRA